MAGRRPAGACGAHVNLIRYHPLNSRGKKVIERQKMGYLKTMFQRSKVIVNENSRKTSQKSGRSCEEVSRSLLKLSRKFVDDVEKVC
jgi:hypothetical protein